MAAGFISVSLAKLGYSTLYEIGPEKSDKIIKYNIMPSNYRNVKAGVNWNSVHTIFHSPYKMYK
jgi:hypothetical protein